jgi:hypothetical protein
VPDGLFSTDTEGSATGDVALIVEFAIALLPLVMAAKVGVTQADMQKSLPGEEEKAPRTRDSRHKCS